MTAEQDERPPKVSCDSISKVFLSDEHLTFNVDAPHEVSDDGATILSTPAIYVTVTPGQADQLRSYFAEYGESEERSGDPSVPRWLTRAATQAGSATESAQFVADSLPDDDERKEAAQQAADLIGDVSESLHEERNAAIEEDN